MMPLVRRQYPALDALKNKLNHALYSGRVHGDEHVARFEDKIAEYTRAKTVCFNSGHSALLAMLKATFSCHRLLVPAFNWPMTASLHAETFYSEIDRSTLAIDVTKIPQDMYISAILAVDSYGICCNYEQLTKKAKEMDVTLLIDSSVGFGAMCGAFPVGRYGDAQVFSFGPDMPFSTMDGGCVCTTHDEIYQQLKIYRDITQTHMLDACALIGSELMCTWPQERHKRTLKGQEYRYRLKMVEGVSIIWDYYEPQWPIWSHMPILIEKEFGEHRDEVIAKLHKRNIMAAGSPGYNALHSVAADVSDRIVVLPMYTDMLTEEMDRVAEALREIQNEAHSDRQAAFAAAGEHLGSIICRP